jgi:hypothetical protein
VVDDENVQVLADQIANDALASHPRPNALIRYGERRGGVLGAAVAFTGATIATWGVYRRVVRTDPVKTERLYAQTAAVDRDRAHADVHYVDQRLRLLALAIEDDLGTLVRDAARVLVLFVTAGRPSDQRLDEVETALTPLREARDDGQPTGVLVGLLPAYLAAWRRALR